MMALYLKNNFMVCKDYVQSFMLSSQSAQFFAMLLYYFTHIRNVLLMHHMFDMDCTKGAITLVCYLIKTHFKDI